MCKLKYCVDTSNNKYNSCRSTVLSRSLFISPLTLSLSPLSLAVNHPHSPIFTPLSLFPCNGGHDHAAKKNYMEKKYTSIRNPLLVHCKLNKKHVKYMYPHSDIQY